MPTIIPEHLDRERSLTPEEVDAFRAEALALLEANATLYKGLSRQLQADEAVALHYVQHGGWNYPDLPQAAQYNPRLALAAIEQNPRAIYRVPPALLREPGAHDGHASSRSHAIREFGADAVAQVRALAIARMGQEAVDARVAEADARLPGRGAC